MQHSFRLYFLWLTSLGVSWNSRGSGFLWPSIVATAALVNVGCGGAASPKAVSADDLVTLRSTLNEPSPPPLMEIRVMDADPALSSVSRNQSQKPSGDHETTGSVKPSANVDAGDVSESVIDANSSSTSKGGRGIKISAEQLIGQWCDSLYGKRTLTISEDGVATMLIEFNVAGRLVYGKKIEFDLKWTIEDDKLTFQILGGSPAETAQSAIKAFGDKLEYVVRRWEKTELEVLCSDGTIYTFHRPATSSEIRTE